MSDLKARLLNDMKDAMRAQAKDQLMVIRLLTSAIKQYEVDNRVDVDDTIVLGILEKQCKQRRESIKQYQDAGRDDLVQQERFELELIQAYLPAQMTEDELSALVKEAVSATAATGIKDMGKVMAWLKPKAQGRVDMSLASAAIKSALE